MTVIGFRVVGVDLPGASCGDYEHVHIGVQRRRDPDQLARADASEVTFVFPIEVVDGDFKGPYVQGGRGARFFYLVWGELAPGEEFKMFRRAKIYPADIDAGLIGKAVASGRGLLGQLGLTDGKGLPLCASVRPPVITWQLD